jgi:hypothetical protein
MTKSANNITYCGSKKVSTNNAIVTKPVHTYQEGSPSRYKTIIKDAIDECATRVWLRKNKGVLVEIQVLA